MIGGSPEECVRGGSDFAGNRAEIDAATGWNWRPDAVAGLALLAMTVKAVWGIQRARDVTLADEAVYCASGARLFVAGFPNDARGLPAGDYSPLYSCWYALLGLFVRAPTVLYFASWSLLFILVSVVVYALARRLGAAPGLALASVFALDVSRFFDVWPYPCEFCALLLGCGLFASVSMRSDRAAARSILITLAASVFVRPELASAAFLLVPWAARATWREVRRDRRRRRYLVLDAAAVGAAALIPALVFGSPITAGRSFYAWGQHYALNAVHMRGTRANPWAEWDLVVQRDFGHVSSTGEALRANPVAFARNVVENAEQFPSQLVDLMTPLPFFPRLPMIVGYGVALVLGAFGVARRLRHADEGTRRLRIYAVTWAALIVPMVVSSLLIHPRHHYLQVVVALGIPLCGAGMSTGFAAVVAELRSRGVGRPTSMPARRALPQGSTVWLAAASLVMLAFAPSRAYGACVQTSLGWAPVPDEDPHRVGAVVATMRPVRIRNDAAILETPFGYAFFAGLQSPRVLEWTKGDQPFLEWLRRGHVGLIVLDDALAGVPSFGKDPQFVAFYEDPIAFGYDVLSVPGLATRIAVRRDAVERP